MRTVQFEEEPEPMLMVELVAELAVQLRNAHSTNDEQAAVLKGSEARCRGIHGELKLKCSELSKLRGRAQEMAEQNQRLLAEIERMAEERE